MDQLWLSAPALALKVWRDRGTTVWRANAALAAWSARRAIDEDQWRRLADAVQRQANHGAGGADPPDAPPSEDLWFAGECLRCSVVPLGEAVVAWLAPARDAAAGEPAAQQWPEGTLDLLQDFGRMGIFERNVRTGAGRWSPQLFRIFGLAAPGPTPRMPDLTPLVHPEDRERAFAEVRAMYRHLGRHENRFRVLHADGAVHHIHGLSELRPGSDGAPETMIGVLIDDTEVIKRMQLHEQLNARLTQAVSLASVSVWRIDMATRRIDLNDVGYQSSGLKPEPGGVPLELMRSLIHPDDREAVRLAAEEAIATGKVVDVTARYRHPEGGYRYLLTRRVAERDSEGRAVALVGVSIDQTQQEADRQRAQTLAERIDIVTRAAGVGVWTVESGTKNIEWNEQMFRIYGLPPGGRPPDVNETLERFVHPDDHATFLEQRAQAGLQDSAHMEFRIVRPDGEVRWLSVWARRVDPADGPLAAYGVTMDVTERKRVEQVLRDKANAEQANRAKSEFLSRMSHELRTPLNAVLGFLQLLMHDGEERLSARQAERLRHAHSAGQHLMALINDVLDLASIESGTLKLETQPVSLQEAIDDVLQWMHAQAERQGVALHATRTTGWVLADGRRLRQILANLLSNAIKYNRARGDVWIEACAQRHGEADGWQLCVRDNGRGMTREQLSHLFEPFNRLGAERESIEGTGIGLAIVRHMAKGMGGRIEVTSEPGRGSAFCLFLPAAQSIARADAGGAEGAAHAPPAPASALTVLYIEDNPINVLLVQEILALRPAMTLHTAADGASGVAVASGLVPDVVLIDMQLPDFDGFEVLRRLRAQPALARCDFIALSASAMPEDVQRAKAAGFRDYWTKPIDFTQFLGGLDAIALARR